MYFHREELEAHALVGLSDEDQDGDHEMSTDTEAAQTVDHLCLGNEEASESLQAAIHDTLAEANAPCPEGEEYYYDSDDSVVNLDVECPEMSQHVVNWVAVEQTLAPLPPWHPSDFGESELVCYSHEPDLREVLNKNARKRMVANIPVQLVAPLTPPPQEVPVFKSVRDLDQQHQRQFDQTIAK